uniref:Glycosyltransferase family 92 protein n=1 Tax=Panagrellus redivivus TaxID=6233 RepID=A0A7E4USZ3_PANRE
MLLQSRRLRYRSNFVRRVIDLADSSGKCKVGIMRLTCAFPDNDAELADFSVGAADDDGVTQFRQPELDYNPLLFTEYASEISNSHECFYHFKESAEFISFPNWDDIIMHYPETPGPTNYYEMFSALIPEHPKAASYSLNRFEVERQSMNLESFHCLKSWAKQSYDQTHIRQKSSSDPNVLPVSGFMRPESSTRVIMRSKLMHHSWRMFITKF